MDTTQWIRLNEQFELFKSFHMKKYMLRVAGKLIGFINEPTIQACEQKMLEVLL